MTPTNRTDGADESSGINRRRMLKTIGAATAGLVAVTGTATAQRSQFTGCQRVCTGTDGTYAVVAVDGTFTCRKMSARDDVDVPWDWQSHCYVADDDETVIGILEEQVVNGTDVDPDGHCTFCPNPNACAGEAYESVETVLTALDQDGSCGVCTGNFESGTDCTTYGVPGDDGTDDSSDGETGDDGSESGGEDSGSDSGDSETGGDDSESEGSSDGGNSGSEPAESPGGGESEKETFANDFDTTRDYDDDREVWKSDLVESDETDGPSWECENTTEDPTAMELWYDEDDTPVDPRDRDRCGPDLESEEDGTLTAIERWFARNDTPDRSD